jgi:hypothetical protein
MEMQQYLMFMSYTINDQLNKHYIFFFFLNTLNQWFSTSFGSMYGLNLFDLYGIKLHWSSGGTLFL